MNRQSDTGTQRMFSLVHALPDQLLESAHLAGLKDIRPDRAGIRRLVLCGMGGSAIAGDLVGPLLTSGRISLTVWRDYGLPHWTGPEDLVLCSSYSGDTEETLSGAHLAGQKGIRRLAITSGGRLASLASDEGFPAVNLPGGLPPRASLGFGLGALVRTLGHLGVVAEAPAAIEQAAGSLNAFRDSRMTPMDSVGGVSASVKPDPEGNLPAAELADILKGRVPVIYTAGIGAYAAGLRLKAQLNENSKVPALLASFPELNHNDLVGWDLEKEARDRFVLLILRGKSDNERIDRRVDLTRKLLAEEFSHIHEISSRAPGVLEHTLSLVQYGDFLSCHLARARDVDPLPVERISRLKEALGKTL